MYELTLYSSGATRAWRGLGKSVSNLFDSPNLNSTEIVKSYN